MLGLLDMGGFGWPIASTGKSFSVDERVKECLSVFFPMQYALCQQFFSSLDPMCSDVLFAFKFVCIDGRVLIE